LDAGTGACYCSFEVSRPFKGFSYLNSSTKLPVNISRVDVESIKLIKRGGAVGGSAATITCKADDDVSEITHNNDLSIRNQETIECEILIENHTPTVHYKANEDRRTYYQQDDFWTIFKYDAYKFKSFYYLFNPGFDYPDNSFCEIHSYCTLRTGYAQSYSPSSEAGGETTWNDVTQSIEVFNAYLTERQQNSGMPYLWAVAVADISSGQFQGFLEFDYYEQSNDEIFEIGDALDIVVNDFFNVDYLNNFKERGIVVGREWSPALGKSKYTVFIPKYSEV
jgi:hypothetical protein